MSTNGDEVFLHYPIRFHQKAFDNIHSVMADGIDYAIHAQSRKYDHEDIKDNIKAAAHYLGLCLPDSYNYQRGSALLRGEGKVMVNVSRHMLFEFYEHQKSEVEVACFCAFTGIKSILGKKPFVKITNAFLLARMFGFDSISDMPGQIQSGSLFQKYSSRYHLDRIKGDLIENWGLKLYARSMRGFYVSLSLSYEDLVRHAESNRKSRQVKKRKAEEAEIVKRILAELEP